MLPATATWLIPDSFITEVTAGSDRLIGLESAENVAAVEDVPVAWHQVASVVAGGLIALFFCLLLMICIVCRRLPFRHDRKAAEAFAAEDSTDERWGRLEMTDWMPGKGATVSVTVPEYMADDLLHGDLEKGVKAEPSYVHKFRALVGTRPSLMLDRDDGQGPLQDHSLLDAP